MTESTNLTALPKQSQTDKTVPTNRVDWTELLRLNCTRREIGADRHRGWVGIGSDVVRMAGVPLARGDCFRSPAGAQECLGSEKISTETYKPVTQQKNRAADAKSNDSVTFGASFDFVFVFNWFRPIQRFGRASLNRGVLSPTDKIRGSKTANF